MNIISNTHYLVRTGQSAIESAMLADMRMKEGRVCLYTRVAGELHSTPAFEHVGADGKPRFTIAKYDVAQKRMVDTGDAAGVMSAEEESQIRSSGISDFIRA